MTCAPLVPPRPQPGDMYRLAFVTSTWVKAHSANISSYNNFVTDVAESVPELLALGASWRAIASTPSVDARDNTETNPSVAVGYPIYLLTHERIASHNASLWTPGLQHPININESGGHVHGQTFVWTGTDSSGGAGSLPLGSSNIFCLTEGASNVGHAGDFNSDWIDETLSCIQNITRCMPFLRPFASPRHPHPSTRYRSGDLQC